jgi:triphosphoribosyl-dephospho-CoA synthase
VPADQSLADGIARVVQRLDGNDTRLVYDAIRLAGAGGLQRVENADVFSDPPADLRLADAMQLAADRDRVARQYTNDFADVLGGVAPSIADCASRGWPLSRAIVFTHIGEIARHGDSLIGRKCGPETAAEARRRAQTVLQSGMPGDAAYELAIDGFDAWLRADGHRRNPGTTADLIAAGLFVLLREGKLQWCRWG